MRDDLTAILVVLDRSGSMAPLTHDTVGGFNSFLEHQKAEPGDAVVTLVLFNDRYEAVFNALPIAQVEPLTARSYSPSGGTALLDAVGRGVNDLGRKLAGMAEKDRPGKVIVAIMTDGEENASREYTREQVRKMIEEQTSKYNWSFLFLGANIDAFGEAGKIGIGAANAMNFVADAQGVAASLGALSACVSAFRGGKPSGFKN